MSWALAFTLGSVFLVVVFATAIAVHGFLQRRLNVIAGAVRRWSAGDFSVRARVPGNSGLARLSQELDAMADAMQQREAGRAQVEDDLSRSRDEALQASLAKSRFLAAASHDLRQPLQSMSMTVALLEMRHKTDVDTVVIARLNRAVANLAELLNTLLDISQLEAGLVKPNVKTFSVGALLNEIADEYCAVAESKGLSFIVQSCDFAVRSDPTMLGRMLRNLTENAIRFTPAGGLIDVFARNAGDELQLIVRDTGIGIPEERRHEIFRAFQQLNNPERDRSKGLGLGLAIVDRMSRLLGHPLVVDSQPGAGSTFTITVPKAADPVPNESEPIVGNDVQGKVLLVEDDELVLTTTAQLLEELGATVTKSRSAEDALRRLETGPFDLIIADYRLPGSSGVELVRQARQRHHGLTAALITGDPSIEELKRLVDLDTEVIQKPVRADRLSRLFSKLTHA